MKTVDARGLSCPEPVLLTQQAVKAGTPVAILVDCRTAQGNILRYAQEQGLSASCRETDEGDTLITIS